MAIGYSDLKNVLRLPDTVDSAYLRKWQTVDGASYEQVYRRIGAALVLFNRSLLSGYYAQYLRVTDELMLKYVIGGDGSELSELTEHGKPDPIFGDKTGHMLPMKDYGGALGWTYWALRRQTAGDFDNDIIALMNRSTNTWQKKLLTRLFKSTADTVGSTGKSVPFADGGTADSTYVPPEYGGKSFLYTHSHYDRQTDDAAGRLAAAKAGARHLMEHGIMSPYDLVIPDGDKDDWAGVTGYKKPERGVLSTAGVEVRATIDEQYMGIVETDDAWFRVKPEVRLPANYCGVFKPMGFGNTFNPLVVRYEKGYPLGLILVGNSAPGQYPLIDVDAAFTFGVGVQNRVAGYCCYFAASGSYTSPTIT